MSDIIIPGFQDIYRGQDGRLYCVFMTQGTGEHYYALKRWPFIGGWADQGPPVEIFDRFPVPKQLLGEPVAVQYNNLDVHGVFALGFGTTVDDVVEVRLDENDHDMFKEIPLDDGRKVKIFYDPKTVEDYELRLGVFYWPEMLRLVGLRRRGLRSTESGPYR